MTDGENRKLSQEEVIAKFQEMVDTIMAGDSEMVKNFARQHKLGLLDSRLSDLDRALYLGLVTIRETKK